MRLVAEDERQHRADRVMQPKDGRNAATAERAVLRDACRDQRVRELQEDGARPAEHDDALGVDALGDQVVHGRSRRLKSSRRVAQDPQAEGLRLPVRRGRRVGRGLTR